MVTLSLHTRLSRLVPLSRCALLPAAFALSACAASVPSPAPAPVVAVAAPVAPVVVPAPPPAPPPQRPLSELVVETHTAFFDALHAHDSAALAKLYDKEAKVYVGLGVAEAHGPDAASALAKVFFDAFPDARVQWSNLLVSEKMAAVELAWTGTHAGPLGAMSPTRKVVGSHVLLLERFTPDGHLAAQHFYFDAESLAADLRSSAGKAHAFDGLPTTQARVVETPVASADDDEAMRGLARSFTAGSYVDARALGDAETSWNDETKGRAIAGRSAVPAWLLFLERSFKGGGTKLLEVWSVGEWMVLEWSASQTQAPDPTVAQAAELVRFEAGHIAEIRTYRSSIATSSQGSKRR